MRWLIVLWIFGLIGDFEGVRTEVERALALDPNHAWALSNLGAFHAYQGQLPEAMTALKKATRASPHDPLTWWFMHLSMVAHYFAGEDAAALHLAERLIRFRPDKFVAYRFRAAALGQLGRIEEAKQALQESIGLLPGEYPFFVQSRPPWIPALQHERLVKLRKAGLTV